uniref:(northern house mosquito) hypothetical protein n=1 Tax=Culex pipiens TaxID=7175 RepID=A0A8D7ZZ46_CULPI
MVHPALQQGCTHRLFRLVLAGNTGHVGLYLSDWQALLRAPVQPAKLGDVVVRYLQAGDRCPRDSHDQRVPGAAVPGRSVYLVYYQLSTGFHHRLIHNLHWN